MAAPTPGAYASNTQASGTSMNVAVGAGTNALIIVRSASRSTSEVFSTPTLTGVTFAKITDMDPGRAQHEDEVWGAYGTWSAGNVVFGYSVSTVHVADAQIFDDVDPSTPYTFVKYRNTNGDSGAATGGTDTTTPDITFSNTDVDQLMLVLASTRNRPLTTTPGDTNFTRLGAAASGTGGSDQSITMEYRTLSPTGSETWNAATSIAVDWVTAAILINPISGVAIQASASNALNLSAASAQSGVGAAAAASSLTLGAGGATLSQLLTAASGRMNLSAPAAQQAEVLQMTAVGRLNLSAAISTPTVGVPAVSPTLTLSAAGAGIASLLQLTASGRITLSAPSGQSGVSMTATTSSLNLSSAGSSPSQSQTSVSGLLTISAAAATQGVSNQMISGRLNLTGPPATTLPAVTILAAPGTVTLSGAPAILVLDAVIGAVSGLLTLGAAPATVTVPAVGGSPGSTSILWRRRRRLP